MKTKNHQKKSIHQHVEHTMRHQLVVLAVLFFMILGISSLDNRVRSVLQLAYVQGWDWFSHYATHEHPAHTHTALNTVRLHTISGSS